MNIYIDDNLADQVLKKMLAKASHKVILPVEVGLGSAADPRHLQFAIRNQLILLTSDQSDFEDLHDLVLSSGGKHPGILIVCSENDPTRDMRPRHIEQAIGKLEKAGIDVNNELFVLNHWR